MIKELVENSLDAGAGRVAVEYDDADGRFRMAVSDDGHGILSEQIGLALARHATSKLANLDDLQSIATFGFRGEALASIAAAADLELTSRTRGQDAASRVVVKGGDVGEVRDASAPPGTRIEVGDLFSEIPARRKFLKTRAAEYAQVADTLRKFALAWPQVDFQLRRNGRSAMNLPPVAGLKARLVQVWGQETAASMVEVSARHAGLELKGYVSLAGVSHPSSRKILIFVNGRWMRDRRLFRALMEAYRTYLLRGRYPAACLFLDITPDQVDVNVHPAKLEVRFADPQSASRFVTEAVAETVRKDSGPLGRWAAGDGTLGIGGSRAGTTRAGGTVQSGAARADATQLKDAPAGYVASRVEEGAVVSPAEAGGVAEEQPLLPSIVAGQPGSLGSLEVIGQVFDGYIVCQNGDEVLIVDQHAAHERLLFEGLMAAYDDSRPESQPLLIPETVTVGEDGVEAVAACRDRLEQAGLELDRFGDEEVVVRAIPALVAGVDVRGLVEKVASDLVDLGVAAAAEQVVERVLATVACHGAVRVGKRMGRDEARALLRQASAVSFSASCPHGRPVSRSISRTQLERMFGRP